MLNFLKNFNKNNNSNQNNNRTSSFYKKASKITNTVCSAVLGTLIYTSSAAAETSNIELNNDLEVKEYTIKAKDNFTKISNKFGVDLDVLIEYNSKYKNRLHLIYPGEKIKIPVNKKKDNLESESEKYKIVLEKYVVDSSDKGGISKISIETGISIENFIRNNKSLQKNPNLIVPSQILYYEKKVLINRNDIKENRIETSTTNNSISGKKASIDNKIDSKRNTSPFKTPSFNAVLKKQSDTDTISNINDSDKKENNIFSVKKDYSSVNYIKEEISTTKKKIKENNKLISSYKKQISKIKKILSRVAKIDDVVEVKKISKVNRKRSIYDKSIQVSKINKTNNKDIINKKSDIVSQSKKIIASKDNQEAEKYVKTPYDLYKEMTPRERSENFGKHTGDNNFKFKIDDPIVSQKSSINDFDLGKYFLHTSAGKTQLVIKSRDGKYLTQKGIRPVILSGVRVKILSRDEYKKVVAKILEERNIAKNGKSPVYNALEAYENKDTLGAEHCTDWVDKVYIKSYGKSIYDFKKSFEGVSRKKINSGTGILAKKYASKDTIAKINPGDHIMVDRPDNGKYGVGKTHSVLALSKPDNGIVKVVSMARYNTPPIIEEYDLLGKSRGKNGLAIRIQGADPVTAKLVASINSINEEKDEENITLAQADTSNVINFRKKKEEIKLKNDNKDSNSNVKENQKNSADIIEFENFYETDIYTTKLDSVEKVNKILNTNDKKIVKFVQKRHGDKKIMAGLSKDIELFSEDAYKTVNTEKKQKKEKIVGLYKNTYTKLKKAA